MTAGSMYPEAWEQAKVDGRVYMLPMNYKEITSYVYLVRGDLMDKYDIKSVASLDEAEAYMDAIVPMSPRSSRWTSVRTTISCSCSTVCGRKRTGNPRKR